MASMTDAGQIRPTFKKRLPVSAMYDGSVDKTVCILAYDGLCTFEFGIAVEVFSLPRPEFDTWYNCRIVAGEDRPLRAAGCLRVETEMGLEALSSADLVIIPGWRGTDHAVPSTLVQALRDANARGARIATICSGVFVLAAAGLLDGRPATTHWKYIETLRKMYPTVSVTPDVLYIDDGDVLTSAGSAAGLDLCLHIVRQDFGQKHANSVARRLVIPAHRDGGQKQFLVAPVPPERGGRIGPLLDLIRGSLNEDWTIARMARTAGLSSRSLSRKFIEATGQSPHEWLISTRITYAAELLETKSTPLPDIAWACGFRSLESFRRAFRTRKGIPPSIYRDNFGLPDASVPA